MDSVDSVDKNEYKERLKKVSRDLRRKDYQKAIESYFKALEAMDIWLESNKEIWKRYNQKVAAVFDDDIDGQEIQKKLEEITNDPNLLGADYENYEIAKTWREFTDSVYSDADMTKLCEKYTAYPDAVEEIIHKHNKDKIRSLAEGLGMSIMRQAEILSNNEV